MRAPAAFAAVVLAAVAGGCFGGDRSGGTSDVPHRSLAAPSLTDEQARKGARAVEREWRSELAARAAADRRIRFATPRASMIRRRLHRAAARYGFGVVSVRIVKGVQGAPRVVVRAPDPQRSARQLRLFIRALDPKRRTHDDRTGWAYEGFYLEARDTDGAPFLAVYNFWRGRGPGGGQWARSESLYPFAHG